jgi:AcrR family transcriptional regulator
VSRPNEVPTIAEPRWRRLPEERPGQILTAALAVFGERGLAAARLEDVAKKAGLSKGTIYLYFPNKEELFREMVRHNVVSAIEEREQLVNAANGAASEVLAQYLRSYWKFIRSEQFAPIFRLIHAELQNFPDLARFYAEEVVARSHRLLSTLIVRGMDSGEFRRADPHVAARMLTAPFVMHGVWCTHREFFESVALKSDEQVLEELIDFSLHALRAREPEGRAASTTP